ncbi:hypothetical protein C2S51_018161 [Perilla frutescens var. frutescens]|nr:hypothetical protein C2S51_018161 [Perilla frutescens var. frutescens]
MNQAVDALNRIKLQLPDFPGLHEKAGALSDCSEFYNLTIMHLNQTLQPNLNSTSFDVQIWLSAALTNLDNCKTTITEQNVTNPIFLHNNASVLIRNSLAINDELMKETTGRHDGFHRWFLDEELLNLSELKKDNAIVVAQDGSGNFRTIKEGLDASHNRRSKGRVVIHVKLGTYREYLEISREMKNVMLVGDGIGKTIITGDRCARSGFTTRESATVKVMGDGFVARDITFRNTAGAAGGQGVALLSTSDQSAFYRCAFEGYQDTLWIDSNRQFYKECQIYGSVDFIFGNAAVVIQSSFIYVRPPQHGQQVVITAQSRTEPIQPTGISIINCKIQADPNQRQALRGFRVYLGRPWESYASVVFLRSSIDGMVDPAGWMDWNKEVARRSTVYYGEYGNYGPGSSTNRRVKWRGFKVIRDVGEAQKFCVSNFINGQVWLPQTGVPFSDGLSV